MDALIEATKDLIDIISIFIQEYQPMVDNTSIITAWAAVAAAAIAAIASVISIFVHRRQLDHDRRERLKERNLEYQKIHLSLVTENRAKWIQEFRELSAEILAYNIFAPELWPNHDKDHEQLLKKAELLEKANSDLQYAISKLQLMLNLVGPFDRVISHYLDRVLHCRRLDVKHPNNGKDNHSECFIENQRKLSICTQVYLKAEWIRINIESTIIESDGKGDGLQQKKEYDEKNEITSLLEKFSTDSEDYSMYIQDIVEKYNENCCSKSITPLLPSVYIC